MLYFYAVLIIAVSLFVAVAGIFIAINIIKECIYEINSGYFGPQPYIFIALSFVLILFSLFNGYMGVTLIWPV